MSIIKIVLFQTPIITLDNKVVHFPYKKAEALFYYMAIEKKATREYITELLWENNDDNVAKKNLRHALYTINKLFPEPVIISPQKSSLIFEPKIDVEIDYDSFTKDSDSINYSGLLLEGFYMKDCLAFEEWLDNKQQEVALLYSNRLRSHLYNKSGNMNIEEIEKIAELCLKDDPLDENVYKYMMELYRESKQYHKAINLYQTLSKVLADDLGLSPSKEITALHHELLDLWIADSSDDEDVQPNINIRDAKLNCLTNAYNAFKNGKPENIIIIGENGIGKSYLVHTSFTEADLSELLLIEVTCFQAERNYPLQVWNNIFYKVFDFISTNNIDIPANYFDVIESFLPMCSTPNYSDFSNPLSFRSFQNAMLKIFQLLSHKKKILLYIDNINAMDKISLEVLFSLFALKSDNIMVVLTSLDVMSYDLTTFVSSMVRANYLTEMYIEPLTFDQTNFFVYNSLPDISFSKEDIERFYNISNGNIFFLVEMINNIKCHNDLNCLSGTAKEVLNDRLNGVTPETRKMLDIISLFQHKAPFSVLEKMCIDQLKLLDQIDEAKGLSLIQELKENDEIYFRFNYHQMRDFIYQKIAPSKLRILHNNVALVLEEIALQSSFNKVPYSVLAYHFSLGKNHGKALYYRLLYLEHISSIYFELYPILDDSILSSSEIEMPDDVSSQFNQIEQELNMMKAKGVSDLYTEMEARLYHAKSRYYILICDYNNATEYINKALESDYTKNHPQFHMDLIKQLIYYDIQTCDMENLHKNIKDGLSIAERINILSEQAIYLRFYGYYYMMAGEKKQAIAALLRSIDLLEKSSPRPEFYVTNIAAAYNYLGELNLHYGNVEAACEYFRKAITLCEEKGYTINATFYTNLGKALFFLDRKTESRKAFVMAHQVYRRSTAIVGCSTMHAFLAYFASIDAEIDHASHHIRMSRRMYERINSPYEKGIFNYIMFCIAKEKLQVPFITRPEEYYKEKCIQNIKCLHDDFLLKLTN